MVLKELEPQSFGQIYEYNGWTLYFTNSIERFRTDPNSPRGVILWGSHKDCGTIRTYDDNLHYNRYHCQRCNKTMPDDVKQHLEKARELLTLGLC